MNNDKKQHVNWRLLDFECTNGMWLMAADLYLYRSINRQPEPVIIRFYRFDPPAITLGYHQSTARAVNAGACAEAGIDVVRRPTGGRALLHRNELNYAVIADTTRAEVFGSGLAAGFNLISHAIAGGLERLRLDVEVAPRRRRTQKRAGAPGGDLCASTTTRYEITCGGKKLVAAAQLRASDRLLQHGTIYLDESHIVPAELFGPSAQVANAVMTDLRHVGRHSFCHEDVLQALTGSFVAMFGPCHRRTSYHQAELDGIAKLLAEKENA
jgi:lipoate-protein ligase A